MDLNDLNKDWDVEPLKDKIRENYARIFLHKIPKQIQPIMRKHHWKVKILSEVWYCTASVSLFYFFFY